MAAPPRRPRAHREPTRNGKLRPRTPFSPRPGVPRCALNCATPAPRKGQGGKASAEGPACAHGGHSSKSLRAAGSVHTRERMAPGRSRAVSCHGHVRVCASRPARGCAPASPAAPHAPPCHSHPHLPGKPPIPGPPLDTCFPPDPAFQSLHQPPAQTRPHSRADGGPHVGRPLRVRAAPGLEAKGEIVPGEVRRSRQGPSVLDPPCPSPSPHPPSPLGVPISASLLDVVLVMAVAHWPKGHGCGSHSAESPLPSRKPDDSLTARPSSRSHLQK